MDRSIISYEELLTLLNYSKETGEFRWKVIRRKHGGPIYPGDIAGSIKGREYREIGINGRLYRAGRLAWFYVMGKWPNIIDHINRNGLDDRFENLRDVTQGQNMQNTGPKKRNATGLKGVTFDHKRSMYVARICLDYKHHYLGHFKTAKEAREVYVAASHRIHSHSTEVAA